MKRKFYITTDNDVIEAGTPSEVVAMLMNGASMIPGNMTQAQYRKLYAKNAMELKGVSIRTQDNKVFAEDIISKGMLIETTEAELKKFSRIGF
jgi:hypothetical protein